MEVSDVIALLQPMFDEMLLPGERASLRFHLVATGDWDDRALRPSDLVEHHSAMVRWRILGEHGGSGSIPVDDGPTSLVRQVQSDLQDFIAEKRFGWGQLRRPRDLP